MVEASESKVAGGSTASDEGHDGFLHERFLPYLLNRIGNRYNQRFRKALKSAGVSLAHWRIIGMLRQRDGLSLSDLGELTIVDQPTLSRSVDQMVASGLVSREPRADDARFLSISLTAKGHEMYERIWPIAWRHNMQGLKGLSEEEQQTLVRLMRRVLANLEPED